MSLCPIQSQKLDFPRQVKNLLVEEGKSFQPVSISEGREGVSVWRPGARMKKNERANLFKVSEILHVPHGQTRVNLLSFDQFRHDSLSGVFQRASSVAEADDAARGDGK